MILPQTTQPPLVGAANQVVATPNGSAGVARPRALAVEDIPEGGGAQNLVDLDDVEVTSLANGDVLRSDGSVFLNIPSTELYKNEFEVNQGKHFIANGGTDVTVEAKTAAGTGGSVGADATGSRDTCGKITVTTGSSGTGAGELVELTFADSFLNSATIIPTVTPANENACTKKWYVSNETVDGFSIYVAEDPGADEVYIFNYHVLAIEGFGGGGDGGDGF